MYFHVDSVEKTTVLGFNIGKLLNSGDIICLTGDLGTGKTHITKGIAKGLNIDDHITSPTFTIVNEYDTGRLKLFHFDVYRVNDPDEICAIGFDDYIFSDAVSIIEWANYIEEILPREYLHINIEKDLNIDENFRKITIIAYGDKYNYIKELKI
ncbi:tRNA (adenosine(37)-N6)-threonylcarbamoyltransferase complex ATPase subunit type 1 TsaE [Clostridium gasigenes]|uniref:tRNA threonylcarbamoyladenosine biosynthesis protein TsaE n=1 Tax=Clostridium gasigenes TaxID=94869 RepID=A0A1H0RXL3_9CLOT|nr:tRNA (adenosine(37)-N6)-threonylcarbamoyltransferase complex ATPase subunit type 1 TsaE [Clostridium gasigenes]MBB6622638.1 tRNA (adenosine(37)-N6)-threonylcarbamoyltransferase complex ATPase subunit type 1 TsaE [Clostridium gasigenes]MBU3088570.1 tRNA (adenosine(37)-N6)-threonylcarbamoyltransferase complex ATPase subunit type 1 TsaE [Clostridium gasigenes]MBU3103833.1 tRNA (adenosine(37)-N6)-threonylcarbamoyltransferase complex ATPase subunit type 1 TsaE [Clostridium gasigenes]MBU3108215.1 